MFKIKSCTDVLNIVPNAIRFEGLNEATPAVYKVYNTKTEMYYIGQTSRKFTDRWWEHVKSVDNCKFHKALKESDLTDWEFSIVEFVDKVKDLVPRENHWIKEFNSIENGYNTYST